MIHVESVASCTSDIKYLDYLDSLIIPLEVHILLVSLIKFKVCSNLVWFVIIPKAKGNKLGYPSCSEWNRLLF